MSCWSFCWHRKQLTLNFNNLLTKCLAYQLHAHLHITFTKWLLHVHVHFTRNASLRQVPVLLVLHCNQKGCQILHYWICNGQVHLTTKPMKNWLVINKMIIGNISWPTFHNQEISFSFLKSKWYGWQLQCNNATVSKQLSSRTSCVQKNTFCSYI